MRGLSPVAVSGGHSSLRCAGLSLSRPLLLRGTGSRRAGSVVVAHGPSCSAACGILPDQGPNPCPPHWQADSQPLRHQGSPPMVILKNANWSALWKEEKNFPPLLSWHRGGTEETNTTRAVVQPPRTGARHWPFYGFGSEEGAGEKGFLCSGRLPWEGRVARRVWRGWPGKGRARSGSPTWCKTPGPKVGLRDAFTVASKEDGRVGRVRGGLTPSRTRALARPQP